MNKLFSRLAEKINDNLSMQAMLRVIMLLSIILLLFLTKSIWENLFLKIWHVFRPFVYGFAVAYVLQPLIRFLETKHISRKISIPIIYILLVIALCWLLFTLIPLLISRLSSFISSMITGVNSLYATYVNFSESGAPNWLQQMVNQAIGALRETQSIIPNLSGNLSTLLSETASTVTIIVLSLIISIYICSSWESIRDGILYLADRSGKSMSRYIRVIDREIGTYIRSLLILMAVKFVEYAIMYYLVGHKDWMLVALLTALGLIVPYIGPMIGNVVGVLTALTLPTKNVVILIICICVLSQVDAYVIEPLIHSRNVKITPLWALFSIYAGGVLAGGIGVMVAIPVYLGIRAVVMLNREENEESSGV